MNVRKDYKDPPPSQNSFWTLGETGRTDSDSLDNSGLKQTSSIYTAWKLLSSDYFAVKICD